MGRQRIPVGYRREAEQRAYEYEASLGFPNAPRVCGGNGGKCNQCGHLILKEGENYGKCRLDVAAEAKNNRRNNPQVLVSIQKTAARTNQCFSGVDGAGVREFRSWDPADATLKTGELHDT